jgi:precorrin-2 dehydrogenase / sirohydrochlorin ferrochelatase
MFPIFLKLDGRRVLVVGAGTIAEGKIRGLLEAHASVSVVAPEATQQIRYWAAAGALSWRVAKFEPADLDGAFLVIVATASGDLNEQIYQEAKLHAVLCNTVDDPEHCDFYYPAVVKRGDLQIAISTNGRSPALAQRLRQELEEQFGPEYEEWVRELGDEREKLTIEKLEPGTRRELLHKAASKEAFLSRYRPHEGNS